MSKKEFVLRILEKLAGKRALAEEVKKFLLLDALGNDSINALVELFRKMAAFMANKTLKEHILKAAETLERMKEMELQDTVKEQEEIEALLATL